jgi:hypothetical protein
LCTLSFVSLKETFTHTTTTTIFTGEGCGAAAAVDDIGFTAIVVATAAGVLLCV